MLENVKSLTNKNKGKKGKVIDTLFSNVYGQFVTNPMTWYVRGDAKSLSPHYIPILDIIAAPTP